MDITTKEWWIAAFWRALRTFFQAVLAVWTAGSMVTEVDWKFVLITAASATLYSFITSIVAGIPEVKTTEVLEQSLYVEEGESVEDYSKFEADVAEDEEV